MGHRNLSEKNRLHADDVQAVRELSKQILQIFHRAKCAGGAKLSSGHFSPDSS